MGRNLVAATFVALAASASAQDAVTRDVAARWPRDWSAAEARARDEQKLILAACQMYPGLAIPDGALLACFEEQELVDLIAERFVPLQVSSIDAVPFSAADRYRMGPSCFGASLLVVTADGDVVADMYLVGSASQWLDEFLRGVLAERGEDAFDATTVAEPIERAERLARRGELDEALRAAREPESLRACLLRARIHRRLRAADAMRSELARADLLLEKEPPPGELRADLEIERALLAAGTGDVAGSKVAFRFAQLAAPEGPRAAEVAAQIALLEAPALDVGGLFDPRWPSIALFDALTLAPPQPLARSEAGRAAADALQRLLADQQPDGSWFVGTDVVLAQIRRPEPLRIAVTAIAAQSLLPERADPRVAAALQRALAWLLAQVEIARATPAPPAAMDYWPWANGYLAWFLADALRSGFVAKEAIEEAAAKNFADLKARQKSNGGWSYLVSADPEQLGEPLDIAMSFTTGAIVAALQDSAAAGLAVPAELHESGLAAVERAALRSGTFAYMVGAEPEPAAALQSPEWVGASGRDAFLAYVLSRDGRGRPEWVERALDRFDENLDDLAREQGKTLMHCGPGGLGSHYVFFDYVNTARVLAESSPRASMRARLLDRVLAAHLADGSFVDNPLLGRAYGTAMALQAMRFLREP